MSTSLLVVEDESMISDGIVMLLSVEPDLQVLGEVRDGAAAIEAVRRERPDVVLMDVRMPGVDGITATREITADTDSSHTTRVLILTTFDDDETVYGALRAGASGFVLKKASSAELISAIRSVAAGHAWIDPTIAPRVIARLASIDGPDTSAADQLGRITARERDVLRLIARGMTNEEIAEHFTVAQSTIRTHVTRILMKTGATTRAKAVTLAYESGLVVPGQTSEVLPPAHSPG